MKHQTAMQARPLPNRLADRGGALLPGLLAALLATALLSMAGCEGSSFDFGGGVGGSGLVWGPMGDEPSCDDLLVDQVCFDSSTAVVTVNGEPATTAALEPGMVLAVEGELNEAGDAGTATVVDYNSLLTGTIENVDLDSAALQVLGDTLLLDKESRLVGFTLSSGSSGLDVEVSGLVDAGGMIRVTRIARRPSASTELSTAGTLRLLNVGAQTFRVRGLEIDYSSAIVSGAGGSPANGLLVRVTLAGAPSSGSAVATSIRLVEPLRARLANQSVVLRGLVTSVQPDLKSLVLDRAHSVRIGKNTQFVGSRADELAVDQRLRVKGRITDSKSILALVVEKLPDALPYEVSPAPLP
ncbi:MAG TPA: hypothetical protein EYG16_07325 [Deltaproteobacteria bacterium]|nr:hypothetical protein [Candidatus Binatota bacterium]HIL13466.1 hypothetical protein [Deltaproteobacteria bacterium]